MEVGCASEPVMYRCSDGAIRVFSRLSAWWWKVEARIARSGSGWAMGRPQPRPLPAQVGLAR